MRTVIRLWFLLSAFAVGAQDSALVDTNGVLVHPTNFISANGIAPLASPALSGNPTAPTATVGDNDTSISTTAFVTAAIEALKALQLWQNTNAVLTALGNLTGGNSSNFFRGTGGFAQVGTNDIPDLVTMLGALQPLDADLTSISGLTWTDANTFLRGDKTLSRDGQNWTNLNASQLLSGTVPMGRLAVGSTNSTTGLAGYWTDGTNRWTSRDGQGLTNIPSANLSGTISIGVLPGLLGSLSTGNGGGALTNLAFPQTTWYTNQNSTSFVTFPAGARAMLVRAVSQGGPGGSGRRGNAGSVRSGGGGGSGGAYGERFVQNLSNLATNFITIVIPALATGGPAVTTDDSNGTNGATTVSTFIYFGAQTTTNTLLRVGSANAFGLGGDGDGSAGGLVSSSYSLAAPGAGGASSATGAAGNVGGNVVYGLSGSGGGAGGGISTGDAPSSGGAGGTGPALAFNLVSAPAGSAGADGQQYSSGNVRTLITETLVAWFGAGGGGSQTNAPAGNGGDGYGWGSAGGGGGASLNGYLSGRGGNGGPSAVTVTFYCSCPAIAAPEWIGSVANWTYDTVSLLKHLSVPVIHYAVERISK